MPIASLTPETLPEFRRRFEALTPETPRKFGTMTPVKMMRHLRMMVEISLGEQAVADQSNVLLRTVVRFIFFHVLTRWPGGLKAPNDFTPEPSEDFAAERAALLAKLDQFARAQAADPERKTVHPVFGPQPLRYWGRIHGVHFAHHFRQFGV